MIQHPALTYNLLLCSTGTLPLYLHCYLSLPPFFQHQKLPPSQPCFYIPHYNPPAVDIHHNLSIKSPPNFISSPSILPLSLLYLHLTPRNNTATQCFLPARSLHRKAFPSQTSGAQPRRPSQPSLSIPASHLERSGSEASKSQRTSWQHALPRITAT
jgi:hypothetical protein